MNIFWNVMAVIMLGLFFNSEPGKNTWNSATDAFWRSPVGKNVAEQNPDLAPETNPEGKLEQWTAPESPTTTLSESPDNSQKNLSPPNKQDIKNYLK